MSDQVDRNEQLRSKIKRVADEAGDLHGRLQFTRLTEAINRARTGVDELEQRLERVRGRGFVWKGRLEALLAEAKAHAPQAAQQVLSESRQLDRRFQGRVDQLVGRARRYAMERNLEDDEHAIDVLEEELEDIQGAIGEAERRLSSISDPVTKAVDAVKKGVSQAEATLDRFDAGSFSLEPGENPIAVYDATWEDAPGGEKVGQLLLTDARIRFEHKEEKVTKRKMFFFAAETEFIQELVLNEPVGYLAASDDTTRGWVFKDQVLAFKWDRQASCGNTTTFEVDGTSAKDLDVLVESIRDGSLLTDRTADATGVSEQIFTFPEKCTSCDGPLPAAVKGQRTLTCPFCSNVNNAI